MGVYAPKMARGFSAEHETPLRIHQSRFWRTIPVKWLMRGLAVLFLGVGMFGVLGCEGSNESEAERLAKSAGDPGKPEAQGVPKEKLPETNTQEEFYKRQMEQQKGMMQKGAYQGKK
jgi:hypothetical protein